MPNRAARLAGLYAVVAAIAAVLLSPLLALSYFATSEGVGELEAGTVSAWAEPGRDLAGGLLTWASPDRVYSTYVQAFALLFPAVLLCALAVRARRSPAGRAERWGWRLALAGYALTSAGLGLMAVALVPAAPASTPVDAIFLTLMLPGMLLSVLGSTVLGIGLVGGGWEPRATAWLLAVALPAAVAISIVLGHNGLALVPLLAAWGATGLRLRRAGARTPAHVPQEAGV